MPPVPYALQTSALTPPQTKASLVGIAIGFAVLATFLRMRVPAITTSLQSRPLVRKWRPLGEGLRYVRSAFAWVAFLLYALAGIAAAGSFIGRFVLWLAHGIDSLVGMVLPHLPAVGQDVANIGLSVVGLYMFWSGLHLVGDVLGGDAHHGGRDGLMFLGPTLFPLVPGWFGVGSAHVYDWLSVHVGSLAANLL